LNIGFLSNSYQVIRMIPIRTAISVSKQAIGAKGIRVWALWRSSGEKWGHPLKGPCQEGKPILGEKIYFLA
jgi:hypothetical protein